MSDQLEGESARLAGHSAPNPMDGQVAARPAVGVVLAESSEGLRYEELPWPLRVRLLLIGFGAAFSLVSLLFLWHEPSTFGVVAGLFFVAGLGLAGLGLVPRQQLHFDRTRRQIVRRRGWSTEIMEFEQVRGVEVVRHSGMDSPDVFEVVVRLHAKRPIRLGAFDSHDVAAHWQQRIVGTIGR